MRTLFTSDTHFGHANIINYCNRPFDSLEHMDDRLIKNWNERVKPDDMVIFCGDFCFRNSPGGKPGEGTTNKFGFYKEKLNGNIVFIRGNHDDNNSVNTKIESVVINVGGHEIYCAHDPHDYCPGYDINIVGHIHGKWKIKQEGTTVLINVGVDVWDYRPVTTEEIFKLYHRFKTGVVDSNGKEKKG